ncbi:MAG: hypothetical protein SGJ19_14240 [Planctomycetia bacterium]|nr:hypothetical protein [Planctomycetia bacterium]
MAWPTFRLRSLLLLILLNALCLAALIRVFGPTIPSYQLNQVKVGMTQVEIRQILGPPINSGDSDWVYKRFGSPGWVEIAFDDNGKVWDLNDESAFWTAGWTNE